MRWIAAILATWLAITLTPEPIVEAKIHRVGEKRVTLYTGEDCSGPAGWTEVDSDATHVTVSCYEDDPPPAPPDDPSPDENSNDNPDKWTL